MNPTITNRVENNNILTFTLENVDVSVANAIRRVILSEINTVVFRTTPYSENKSNIILNTSRMNNEILKQRLSCVPIHIKDMDENMLKNYIMELNVINDTDKVLNVTTKDFKIKNTTTNTYLTEEETKRIFKPYIPLNSNTEYYIVLLYLRPKLSEEILGEKIQLTCEFSIGNSKEDGMFNVVSTCSFGNTPDYDTMNTELEKRVQQMKDENIMTGEEIKQEMVNWKLLNGLRYFKKNSYEFIIETIGVFENYELVCKACEIIIEKINNIENSINTDSLKIESSQNTMSNCYDITLENEDYTIGNLLKFVLYTKFYEENKILSYCGFKKFHPHSSESIIRLAYIEPSDKSEIISNIQTANTIIIDTFKKIHELFYISTSSSKTKLSSSSVSSSSYIETNNTTSKKNTSK